MNNTINKTNHGSAFSYRGTVNVSITKQNRILSTKTYHNSGLPKFFKGICDLLATGSSDALKTTIPKTLVLYTFIPDANPAEYFSDSWDILSKRTLRNISTNEERPVLLAASSALPVTPVPSSSEISPKVSFQARIPYDLITSSQIYCMALFPSNSKDNSDALAFYRFSNAAGWDALTINSANYDYNLLVDWQMDFNNFDSTIQSGGL